MILLFSIYLLKSIYIFQWNHGLYKFQTSNSTTNGFFGRQWRPRNQSQNCFQWVRISTVFFTYCVWNFEFLKNTHKRPKTSRLQESSRIRIYNKSQSLDFGSKFWLHHQHHIILDKMRTRQKFCFKPGRIHSTVVFVAHWL